MTPENYNNLNGKGLQQIYSIQARAMERYCEEGLLVPFPLSWAEYSDQNVYREYLGYLLEEIGETRIAYSELTKTLLNNSLQWREKNEENLLKERHNLLHEVADMLAFHTELLIFCSIRPMDISLYMQELCKNLEIKDIISGDHNDILQDIFNLSMYLNITTPNLIRRPSPSIKIINDGTDNYPFNLFGVDEKEGFDRLILEYITTCLETRMPMKAKPWRVNPPKLNLVSVLNPLLESFINLFRIASYVGFDKWSIVEVFQEKHQILSDRVTQKY